jgi:hypothetical protein
MKNQKLTRRDFLQTTAAGAAVFLFSGSKRTFSSVPELLKINEPFHGAILHERLAEKTSDGLKIKVCGEAALRDTVTVNWQPTIRAGTNFSADIILDKKINEITAVSQGSFGSQQHSIKVVWDKHSFRRYRFGIDDNSFFLRDITQKNYKSLFDCFYLKMLQDLNRKYGTKFVLNIYYTTGDDFNLMQFPDKYKDQWKDNCEWLKLAFHAYANDPDRPYQYAPVEKLMADFDLVAEQIHRFAGADTYSPPTVVHWASVIPESLKPLYQKGVRVLSGGFVYRFGEWDGAYHLDDARSEYIARSDGLMDFDSGIIFSKGDITCNKVPVDRVVPLLESIAKDPRQAEIMDCFTHEQYFWPFYSHYIPDHAQRLDTAIRWLTEHGYKPVFFHEGLLGGPDWDKT